MTREITSLPITYDALAIEQPGKPVSRSKKTISSLAEDEVLIRVAYASVNKMDPALAQRNVFSLPTPYVLGFDFSGEVVRLGSEGGFLVGDQVFGSSIVRVGGCFAEYLVTKKEKVLLRGAIPAPEASTYGIAYLTAYESLVVTGDIQRHAGKTIYIAGAGGGLGHFAVQIAKMNGLKVIGSAGKAASLHLLRDLHVDHIIDYSKQDVVNEILALTNEKGVDLVYDSTYNQSSYTQSTAVIASGGTYIRLGTLAQLAQFGLSDMSTDVERRGATMVVADLGRYSVDAAFKAQMPRVFEGLKQALAWYEADKVKPFITETVPFDAAALQAVFEAFMKGTNNVGKVVVRCGEPT